MAVERIYRYDDVVLTSTQLDPMGDLVAWIASLRSVGFVSDILRSRHGFKLAKDASQASRAISAHADIAVQFLEQGLDAGREVAFLPLFYALANLGKISIIAAGHGAMLEQQRLHGVTWSGAKTQAQRLLTDHVTLKRSGTLPLLYQSLTGGMWPRVRVKQGGGHALTFDRKLQLDEVYPYITWIGLELQQVHTYRSRLPSVRVTYRTTANGGRVVVEGVDVARKAEVKLISGLRVEGRALVTEEEKAGTGGSVRNHLVSRMKRYLIWDDVTRVRYDLDEGSILLPDVVRTIMPLSVPTYSSPRRFQSCWYSITCRTLHVTTPFA